MAITIGPVVLQWSLLSVVISAGLGYLLMRWRLRGMKEAAAISSIAASGLLAGVVVWKLSAFVLEPELLSGGIQALFYFHGGVRGGIGALAAIVIYLAIAFYRKRLAVHIILDALSIGVLSGVGAYGVLQWITGESRLSSGVIALWLCGLAAYLMSRKRFMPVRQVVQLLVAGMIGTALLHTVVVNGWERGGLSWSGSVEGERKVGLQKGRIAPDFELEAMDGQFLGLEDFRGQTVVVNFWATWCPPCRAEMPYLQQFYDEYGDKNAVVLGVNATTTEASRIVVEAWAKEWGLTFPIVYDENDEVGRMYRISAYPATYIIGPDGAVKAKHQGPLTYEQLKRLAGVRD